MYPGVVPISFQLSIIFFGLGNYSSLRTPWRMFMKIWKWQYLQILYWSIWLSPSDCFGWQSGILWCNSRSFVSKGDYLHLSIFWIIFVLCKDASSVLEFGNDKSNPFYNFDKLLAPKSVQIDPLLYVNRALTYEEAISDCNEALLLDASCVKALYRKSECERTLMIQHQWYCAELSNLYQSCMMKSWIKSSRISFSYWILIQVCNMHSDY